MYGILQRRYEQSRTDRQERLMLSFDKMFAREKGNALWKLHEYWRENASRTGRTPKIDEFQYKTKLPASVSRYVSWSDVTASDPLNYVTHEHTHQTAFRDHSNRRLGDHPSPMNAKACAMEYMHCVRTKQPIYFEIDQKFGAISRNMMRLIVPLADQSGNISRLIYAVRIISSSDSDFDSANSREI